MAIIQIGTEDIVSGSSTPEKIILNISKVIKALQKENKNVKIVLANTVPVKGKIEEVALLNRLISQYIETHHTGESPIVMVDLNTGFDTISDLADDGVLPSATGAKKMASVFAATINELLGKAP